MPSSERPATAPIGGQLIDTPGGPARVWVQRPRGRMVGTLLLGHGAGRGSDTADLLALSQRLPELGIAVVRVDQPWVVAGRRVAVAPPRLDEAWLAVVPAARELAGAGGPLFVGGRSAGARVACRTASELGAAGVVALGFPLHPPGRSDRSRAHELVDAGVSALVVQGDRDSFGSAAEMTLTLRGAACTSITVVAVPHADHSLRVSGRAPITAQEALDLITTTVGRWLMERRSPKSSGGHRSGVGM